MSLAVENDSNVEASKGFLVSVLPVLTVVFLYVLPMPGKNALRTVALALALGITLLLRRRESAPPLPLKAAFLAWAAIALVSVLYSLDPRYSLSEIKVEILYPFVTYFVFYRYVSTTQRLSIHFAALLAGLATILLAAVVLVFRGNPLIARNYIYDGVGLYTTYLITLFPVVMLVLAGRVGPRLSRFAWPLVPIALFTAYKTYNRMFWLALALSALVALALIAYKTLRRCRKRTIVVAAAVILAIVAIPLVGAMKHRVTVHQTAVTHVVDKTVEVDPRPALWRFVIRKIAAHPLVGSGFGLLTFDLAYPQWHLENGLLFHAHNIFLDAGVEMGVPGLIVFMLVFAFLLREYWRFYRSNDPGLWWLGVCGITLVIGVVTKNMTDHFLMREQALLFWALNGMIIGLAKRLESPVTE